MLLFKLLLIVLCYACAQATRVNLDGAIHSYTYIMDRIFAMMKSYYDAGDEKIKRVGHIRMEFENTREFEEGYIMGEIIERYRMQVEQLQAMHKYQSYTYVDTILRLEAVQKIYFEVYHFVNMMHEIPRKYGEEGKAQQEAALGALQEMESDEEFPDDIPLEHFISIATDKASKKKLKERLKKQKKQRQLMIFKGKYTTFHTTKHKGPRKWPLDYGWEFYYN